MVKDKNGLKDKLAGKFKEVEGKLTGDKAREAQGKAQQAKGKVKGKINEKFIFKDPCAGNFRWSRFNACRKIKPNGNYGNAGRNGNT